MQAVDLSSLPLPPAVEAVVQRVIMCYFYPDSLCEVAATCATFFSILIAMCSYLESLNPEGCLGGLNKPSDKRFSTRIEQIKHEISDTWFALVASTCSSLAWFRWVYTWRWAVERAPVVPSGGVLAFALEAFIFLLGFEINGYLVHRVMHWRGIYAAVHKLHHLYRSPTAYAAQAITWDEGVIFAVSSQLVSLVYPISMLTQYTWGLFLLVWSIVAHDSEGYWDKGMHKYHHLHPRTNYGFLGSSE
jgi:sterol desaturase/sphingolipid hydroxylase (fatty acid hydroxylase superfamily)